MSGQYDFDGNPISYAEWCRLSAGVDRRKWVAYTELGDGVGLDYRVGPGAPLIYETMIFDGPHNHYCHRYPNRIAAQAGHDQAVALASAYKKVTPP